MTTSKMPAWIRDRDKEMADLRAQVEDLRVRLARERELSEAARKAAELAQESARAAWRVGVSVHARPRVVDGA